MPAAALLVALPTSIVAMLKLRRRDLSAILEGSGWAINARMRLTRRQRNNFTQQPAYPRGAKGVGRPVRLVVVAAILLTVIAAGAWLLHRQLSSPSPIAAPATKPATTAPSQGG